MTLFSFKEAQDFRRGNLITWTTAIPSMVRDFFDADGKPEDPLKGTGAELLFLSLPLECLTKGQEAEARGKIEETLDSALLDNGTGQIVGGGLGHSAGFIDILLFDAPPGFEIIKQTVQRLSLPKGVLLWRYAEAQGKPVLQLS